MSRVIEIFLTLNFDLTQNSSHFVSKITSDGHVIHIEPLNLGSNKSAFKHVRIPKSSFPFSSPYSSRSARGPLCFPVTTTEAERVVLAFQ